MEIFGRVADLSDARQARADVEIDVRQMAVLGVTGTNADGCGVSVLDVEVDVLQGAVERARVGVANRAIVGGAVAGEPNHVLMVAFLEAGSVGAENEDGPMRAVADHADAGPDVDGLGQAILSLGNEDDSFFERGIRDLIDRRLNGSGVVADAVAMQVREIGFREIDSLGIVETESVIGRAVCRARQRSAANNKKAGLIFRVISKSPRRADRLPACG